MGRSFKCYWAQNWRPNPTTPVLSSIWNQEKKPHHSRSKAMWVSFYDVGLLERPPFYTLLHSIIFNYTCFWSHWPYVNIAVPIIPPCLNILSLEFWKCPTPLQYLLGKCIRSIQSWNCNLVQRHIPISQLLESNISPYQEESVGGPQCCSITIMPEYGFLAGFVGCFGRKVRLFAGSFSQTDEYHKK